MREPRIFPTVENAPAFAKMAKKLGWTQVVVVGTESEKLRQAFEAEGLDMDTARQDGKKEGADLLYTVPKDLEASKRLVEQGSDGLAGWWKAGGINFVVAKLATENKVPVCVDFSALLHESRRGRIAVFAVMAEAARYLRKYQTPVLISSGAQDPWEMRSPSDLLSFGRVLGLEDAHIKAGWK